MSDFLQDMNWRYATKKYDASKAVPAEKLDRILEAIRLAPTSSGLQPFEVLVVTNPEVREKIKAVAWNQAQVTDSSHLLVFAAWDDITAERVNMMFDLTNQQRGTVNEGWEAYRQQLLSIVAARAEHRSMRRALHGRPTSHWASRCWRLHPSGSTRRRWKGSIPLPWMKSWI